MDTVPTRIPRVRITDGDALSAIPFASIARYAGSTGWKSHGPDERRPQIHVWEKAGRQILIGTEDGLDTHPARVSEILAALAEVEGVSELTIYWALLDMIESFRNGPPQRGPST